MPPDSTSPACFFTGPAEGTARGAWMLTRWTSPVSHQSRVARITCESALATALLSDWGLWKAAVMPHDAEVV